MSLCLSFFSNQLIRLTTARKSAWTFTGAAAKAYEDGLTVLFIFWGNALGFFVAAWYFAERYRKLRVETAMEVIKVRFGRSSEQVYTWISFPLTILFEISSS